jgi:hypothetical protein
MRKSICKLSILLMLLGVLFSAPNLASAADTPVSDCLDDCYGVWGVCIIAICNGDSACEENCDESRSTCSAWCQALAN